MTTDESQPTVEGQGPTEGDVEGDAEAAEQARDEAQAAEILAFWEDTRMYAGQARLGVVTGATSSEAVPPLAWSFGDNPTLADSLLAAVLSGAKTATSSSAWEYDEESTPMPRVGELSIILDGAGHPRALIRTTAVDVVPFDEVDADFALAEGEDDGSLEMWRAGHRTYFERTLDRPFTGDMPVVCERFELRYPR